MEDHTQVFSLGSDTDELEFEDAEGGSEGCCSHAEDAAVLDAMHVLLKRYVFEWCDANAAVLSGLVQSGRNKKKPSQRKDEGKILKKFKK